LRAGVALALVATFGGAVFAAGVVLADLVGWAARELADSVGWAALAGVPVALLGVAVLAAALRVAFSAGAVAGVAFSAGAAFSGALLAALLALAGALFAFLVGSALASAAFAALAVVLVGVAFAVADLLAGADFFVAAAVFLAGADLVVALVAGAFFDGVARPLEDAVFPGAAACAAVFFTATPCLGVAAGAACAAFLVGALAGDRLTTRDSVLSNCVATCAGMVLLLALRRPSARSAIDAPHMQNRRAAGRRAL